MKGSVYLKSPVKKFAISSYRKSEGFLKQNSSTSLPLDLYFSITMSKLLSCTKAMNHDQFLAQPNNLLGQGKVWGRPGYAFLNSLVIMSASILAGTSPLVIDIVLKDLRFLIKGCVPYFDKSVGHS